MKRYPMAHPRNFRRFIFLGLLSIAALVVPIWFVMVMMWGMP